MTDQTRHQLAEIRARHRRRDVSRMTPDEIVEMKEDCDDLIHMLAKELVRENDKREGTT